MSRPPDAFLILCLLDSIDLPAIDAWLAAMKPSANRDQLLLRRKRAEAMFLADSPDELWQAPLEFLGSAMYAARQRKALLPLARAGKAAKAGNSRGGKNKPVPAWHAKAIEHAKLLLVGSARERHDLASLCAKRFSKSDDAVRRVLQGAGLVPKRGKNRAKN